MNRTLAKLGVALSAFGIFTCGWLAMSTDDWRRIVLYSLLALGAGAAAWRWVRRRMARTRRINSSMLKGLGR